MTLFLCNCSYFKFHNVLFISRTGSSTGKKINVRDCDLIFNKCLKKRFIELHCLLRLNNTVWQNTVSFRQYVPWRSLQSIHLEGACKNATGILFLIQIWSDSCYKNCVWWWWRRWWYWLVTRLCLLTDNESTHLFLSKWQRVFLFFPEKPNFKAPKKSAIYSLCKRLCCIHWFSYNNVVWIDFNYYSIHVYQENLIQLLSVHHSFQCAVHLFEIIKWTEMNAVAKWFQTVHSGYNIESW